MKGEARGAESRADFVHKIRLAAKEVRESRYWLNVIQRPKLLDKDLSNWRTGNRKRRTGNEPRRPPAQLSRSELIAHSQFPVLCSPPPSVPHLLCLVRVTLW